MKNMMVLVLGVMMVAGTAGCQKKETVMTVEEPIVTEETTATAMANLDAAAINVISDVNAAVATVPSALEAAAPMVEQAVTTIIENPTAQQIQEALKNAGYYEGKIDGDIGPRTKRAIEKFQADNGLKADGKVGPKTWAKLGVHLAQATIESAQSVVAPVTEPILTTDSNDMNVDAGSN